tara:strand:- start:2963 stop:3970 length:1008 start_codon:yes stop_codon:yes gene_type:complete
MDNLTFKIHNRRYLGNKKKLLVNIEELIRKKIKKYDSFIDIFSGTGVVASRFNNKNIKIITNDILQSNYIINKTFLGIKKKPFDIEKKIESLNQIKTLNSNYFSKNFGNKYFSLKIAKKIGAIRDEIEKISDSEDEKNILITSLIFAFDKIANTVGHYDAYREVESYRNDLVLQMPLIDYKSNQKNIAYCQDANHLAAKMQSDVVYIDPPYNSRQYSDTYHLLENVVTWQKPTLYGKAMKLDRAHIKSKYCTKDAPFVFSKLIQNLDTKHIIVSYNNTANSKHGRSNAKISYNQIKNILMKKGKTEINEIDFKAFTTGKNKTFNHKEILFYCRVK